MIIVLCACAPRPSSSASLDSCRDPCGSCHAHASPAGDPLPMPQGHGRASFGWTKEIFPRRALGLRDESSRMRAKHSAVPGQRGSGRVGGDLPASLQHASLAGRQRGRPVARGRVAWAGEVERPRVCLASLATGTSAPRARARAQATSQSCASLALGRAGAPRCGRGRGLPARGRAGKGCRITRYLRTTK